MFSGIIEEFATVVAIEKDRENIDFTLKCSFVDELKIDQSVAHNGVCLTVVKISGGTYVVTAMKETLDRTNLGLLKVGDKVNVERSMLMNGRLDGHIVQGHVDQTENRSGNTRFQCISGTLGVVAPCNCVAILRIARWRRRVTSQWIRVRSL